jgi:hypothetical protein
VGHTFFHCTPPLCLDGMILDPGEKLISLEGPEQAVISVVFAVVASWRVVGGSKRIIGSRRSTIIVVFLVLLFLIIMQSLQVDVSLAS